MISVDTIENRLIENRLTSEEIKEIGGAANRWFLEHHERTTSECYENHQHITPVFYTFHFDSFHPRGYISGQCLHCLATLKRQYNSEEMQQIAKTKDIWHTQMNI